MPPAQSSDGDTFTLAEYRKWLESAGLKKVHLLNTQKIGCDVVMAEKPAKSRRG